MDIKHGPDLGNARAVQVGHRLKAANAALIDETHQEGLHGVIIMVPQGQLIESLRHQRLIQSAPAHFGAHGAGVLLLAIVKNNGADFRLDHGIRDLQFPAHFGDAAVIHAKAHINGNGLQLKTFIMVLPQGRQKLQQHQGILAAGNTYGNFISVFNHRVVFHAPAD